MVFVSLIKTKTQKKLLNYFFGKCTNFSVIYPKDNINNPDNPLLEGKKEFLKLENISIDVWNGMEDSIKIYGNLNKSVQAIFYHSLTKKGIWQYSLFVNEEEVFIVNDFDIGVLNIPQVEINYLIKNKIVNSNDFIK